MLSAKAFTSDPVANLQLGLGIELSVLPPYLYALWSIKPGAAGASVAAREAANAIRAVVYEEMLHAALAANVISSLGVTPQFAANLMTYPGTLPGHVTTGPYAYQVGLIPLSTDAINTFLKIEMPEWDVPSAQHVNSGGDWITIAAFYDGVIAQLQALPAGSFGKGTQLPRSDNPGPGRLVNVNSLQAAVEAIDIIVDQGEGHKPPPPPPPDQPPDMSYQLDDQHEVAHYYQFQTIGGYFTANQIDAATDLYPVIPNPNAAQYTAQQQQLNTAFNALYTQLIDSLQYAYTQPAPSVFGGATGLMNQLAQAAAQLRNAGFVPGTQYVAGPTFTYLGTNRRR
ncbi:MAG TPA: ferritin-like protein [Gemmatimonadaceae bacterium]|nr:ferritin-like protein [Gemmatimonadaceae bacterium]